MSTDLEPSWPNVHYDVKSRLHGASGNAKAFAVAHSANGPVVILKRGHVQPIWAGHPWVYAQAVQRVDGDARAGDEVIVRDPQGHTLGRGLYAPESALRVRVYSRDPEQAFDAAFVEQRLRAAQARRALLGLPSHETTGFRLVHSEGDALPGLVVDRFGEDLVVQLATPGIQQRRGVVLDAMQGLFRPRRIIDRSPSDGHQHQPGKVDRGKVDGSDAGSETPEVGLQRGQEANSLASSQVDPNRDPLRFMERGLRFELPLDLSQKTGFYFDLRDLRGRIETLSRGRDVLDCYSYVGAPALAALRGGARRVHAVDSSDAALQVARRCAELNNLGSDLELRRGNAVKVLSELDGAYDLIICDPPKLAPRREAKQRAMSYIRRLAGAAAKAVRPDGWLVVCSCSAALDLGDVTRALALGARDVGREPVVLERYYQGADHPVPAAFPEGLYLSAVLAEIRKP